MVLTRRNKVAVDLRATRDFVQRIRRCLRLGRSDFNVCFVGDREIAELNATYRGIARPTDVLSFPWRVESKLGSGRISNFGFRISAPEFRFPTREFRHFLGDIVISAETARRSAKAAGHSTAREIRWLILHGVLHLLGHDHETDRGEMAELEVAMRQRLNI